MTSAALSDPASAITIAHLEEPGLAAFAEALAQAVRTGGVIYLHGDLGAGKTTTARALIRSLIPDARVKSPTYSLIESYRMPALVIHHLDLYRIADPGELEWLGLDELQSEPSLVLVEWPERGGHSLPAADLVLHLGHAGSGRSVRLEAASEHGARQLASMGYR
ncbi:tRNA (adenosine(37)-N6)-threonylcarbamoyltransferase complex ATPase subunit type 1 TsaE [Tahibacter amnicola]|uniref:tRNA threonylcarbamoyladenosine biosynthesis protein TsaE n=1 Tax=Tahibacter amnicola TaxID=2976241 RepID=A0ABY6BA18_9GAMM|nr:tRNA (adenosine(37)-N6)-threonylcarbamoyltransferase complex ATPase subunit type 1 TsaE [Tahibacter amnicola]UXI66906.1 tRNA (adenosine(37)-N6)-threonylcarbamoyltransferase complex ATPase subunit type 1 TsaE [Tahibacter amnicola]